MLEVKFTDQNKEEQTLYTVFESTQVAKMYDVYISSSIRSPEKYSELLNALANASGNDIFRIHLNTPGGQANTAVQIMHAFRSSAAKIVTIAEGDVASAGTMLLLSGDEIVIREYSTLMFHNFSAGAVGKGHELYARTDHYRKFFPSLLRELYYPFLEEDELDAMMEGKDFYFGYDETVPRLERFGQFKMQEIQHCTGEASIDEQEPSVQEEEPQKKSSRRGKKKSSEKIEK